MQRDREDREAMEKNEEQENKFRLQSIYHWWSVTTASKFLIKRLSKSVYCNNLGGFKAVCRTD